MIEDPILIDANLLLLLVVGSADRQFIASHKRLQRYDREDFDVLTSVISGFSDIVLVPHVLTEVGNLARQIGDPIRAVIQRRFRFLIETSLELPAPSRSGTRRAEFSRLGLTDSVLLAICAAENLGLNCTLLTADESLANHALSLGYPAIDFEDLSS